jgi:pyoverdine/dityrosine biosynthesis protein Dit1
MNAEIKVGLNLKNCSTLADVPQQYLIHFYKKGIFEQVELEKYSYPDTTNTILEFQLSSHSEDLFRGYKKYLVKEVCGFA